MRAVKNITIAMANSVVTIVVSLVALPFYLRYLGMEAYGLIGFSVTLQAVSQALDLGLAPTISREVARSIDADGRQRVATLLHTLGIVYIGVSVLIVIAAVIAAPWIGQRWLTAEHVSTKTIVQAVMLMGVSLACRWPISLYQGALVGAHRLALSSTVNIVVSISAALVALTVLAHVSSTIQAFFIVQAAFNLIQACTLRLLAWKVVGVAGSRFDLAGLRRVWRFSAGMGAITITSLAFTQLDKGLLSKILDLEDFGHYMLAALVVSGLQVVVSPVFNSIYPRFSALAALGKTEELARIYSLGTRMTAAMLFPLAWTLVFHAQDLVLLWTGKPDVAMRAAPIIALLAIGSGLNGIMHFPYALQLARGATGIPLAINLGLLVLLAPLTVTLAMSHGTTGGALSWAIVGLVYVFVGTWLTGKKIMPSAGWRWLAKDVAVPLAISLCPVLLGAWVCKSANLRPMPDIIVASFAAFLGAVACASTDASIRRWVGEYVYRRNRLSAT